MKALEGLAQDARRNTLYCNFQFTEAMCSSEQGMNDKTTPLVADPIQNGSRIT
jgi:hypothetical protein